MVVIFSERGGKWKNVVVLNYSKVMYAMVIIIRNLLFSVLVNFSIAHIDVKKKT